MKEFIELNLNEIAAVSGGAKKKVKGKKKNNNPSSESANLGTIPVYSYNPLMEMAGLLEFPGWPLVKALGGAALLYFSMPHLNSIKTAYDNYGYQEIFQAVASGVGTLLGAYGVATAFLG